MTEGPPAKTLTALEAVEECLRLCDMYADENLAMAADTAMHPVKLRAFVEGWLSNEDVATFDHLSVRCISHNSQAHAAREIARTIRERFGIQPDPVDDWIKPPKSGE